MREIKFRAWHIEDKFMFSVKCIDFTLIGKETGDPAKFWVYMCFDEPTSEDDQEPVDVFFPGDAVELMQYTGLHDKNGKEIYEGDIVVDESIYRTPDWQYQIIWSDLKAGWIAYPSDESNLGFGMSKEASFSLEVIGNIYETPDLQKYRI